MCHTCAHYDHTRTVGFCAVVRAQMRGMGIHVLPEWQGVLVPVTQITRKDER